MKGMAPVRRPCTLDDSRPASDLSRLPISCSSMRLPLPSDALADRAAWQPFARDLLLDAASVTTNTALGAPPPTSPLHTQVLLDGALTASVQSFGMFSYGSQIVNLKSVVD